MKQFLFCCLLYILLVSCAKDPVVLMEKGITNYQIVIPDKEDKYLPECAQLIQEAFSANNASINIVRESGIDKSKPGIYVGSTEYARSKGIEPSMFKSWDYVIRLIGEDIIIAGSQVGIRSGTVKAVCDFLHDYAGTRFLAPGKTGIEFMKLDVISVPGDLDISKKPVLKFNTSGGTPGVDFYNIANNAFPAAFKLMAHSWPGAIPYEKYSSHIEYSALVGGKRTFETKEAGIRVEQYCLSNADVQELIYKDLLRQYDEGNEIVSLGQPDGNTQCQCEECRKLYDTGDDWGDKTWIFNKILCERLQKDRPDAGAILLSYQTTTLPPKSFKEFPDNAIILLTHYDSLTFTKWNQISAPGGFAVYIYNWGVYHLVGHLPKKTPSYLENQVKTLGENNVTGIFKDGVGSCYGLEGPAYYVFGRMFDDPSSNSSQKLLEEYYQAAYGESVEPMTRFFGEFYNALELYSEFLGPRDRAQRYIALQGRKPKESGDPLDWVSVSASIFGSTGVRRYIETPDQMLITVYSPDLLIRLEKHLKEAESKATGEKVIKRIKLVRNEFDYIKGIIKVLTLYNAWQIDPVRSNLDRLLSSIDSWNQLIDSYYDADGKMKPLDGWPEMKLFRGGQRAALGLVTLRRWEEIPVAENPFAWNTNDVRKGKFKP